MLEWMKGVGFIECGVFKVVVGYIFKDIFFKKFEEDIGCYWNMIFLFFILRVCVFFGDEDDDICSF